MSNTIENLEPSEIGKRLKTARENAGLTQLDVADKINIARTTLVAIEQGQRKVRILELQNLCKLYGTSINSLFRDDATSVDFELKFRKLSQTDNIAASDAAKVISKLARAELELENLLGIKRLINIPPRKEILDGDVASQAENDAMELRHWLGIGMGPIPNIISLLELNMGMRVFVKKLASKISGAFAYDIQTGPCILLNAGHPITRRNFTAAHELGHFITCRNEVGLVLENSHHVTREEKYSNEFAYSFLMPARTLKHQFKDITAGQTVFTRKHVIILADYFYVSREALVRRLEALKIVKSGTWEWFQSEGGISNDQAKQVLGNRYVPSNNLLENDENPVTLKLSVMASEVYRQGLLSEGQLAQILGVGIIDLRKIVDEYEE